MATTTANRTVTIYTSGEFMGNIHRIEARLVEHGRKPFAQYDLAPYVIFVPKGKRKARIVQGSYKPFILILAGTGHPEPDSLFGREMPTADGMATTSKARHMSFGAGWKSDFNAMIGAYLDRNPAIEVVADYRDA